MSEDKKPVVERMRIELQKQLRAERRERIATAALQGMLASAENATPNEWSYVFATRAIEYADALIAELDKEAAAEIERLRAENEQLRVEKDLDASSLVLQRQEIERLTREHDEARYFLAIFVHAHASNNAVPPHIEEQARKALEAKS